MAGITTNGIGSGLNINDLVSQLVAAEVTPARNRLDQREAGVLARVSAFGLIKSALSDLDSAASDLALTSGFRSTSVVSSNDTVLTASSNGALRGSFQIDVQRLAEKHRLISQAGMTSEIAPVGTGTLTLSVGGSSFDVVVDGSNNGIADIRDAINSAENNTGVTATLIKVDDGVGGKVSKLVLTANDTGESSRITVTAADDDGNNTDATGLSQLSSAQLIDNSPLNLDALITVDSQTVTSASNTLEDTIEGVTLTLVAADPGNPVTISASEDRSVAIDKVKTFIESFNAALQTLNDATFIDTAGGQDGALVGDATARLIESRMRSAVSDPTAVNSAYTSLASIGVTTGDDGNLALDEAQLQAALDSDFDGVVSVFTSTDGVASRLRSNLTDYLQFGGVLDSRGDSLDTQIADIGDRRTRLAARESALEARFLAQFSAMDALVASLQATGDFLTQQLDALTSKK